MRRVPALDGLRGVALLLVLACHARLPGTLGTGQAGVVLFFVLSGYLITGFLVGEIDRSGRVDLRGFYRRRIRRLGPAMVAFLAGAAVLVPLIHPEGLWAALCELPGVLLFFTNWRQMSRGGDVAEPFGAMWSLSIEEQFYLVWPVLFAFLWRRVRWRVLVLTLIVSGALGSAALRLAAPTHVRAYQGTDTTAFALLAGAAVAVAMHAGILRQRRRAGLLVAGTTGMVAAATAWPGIAPGLHLADMAVLEAIAGVALLVGAVGGEQWLEWAWLRWCGRVSYAWYLWHGLLLWTWPSGGPVGRVSAIAFSGAVAAASWRWVESPVLKRATPRGPRAPRPQPAGAFWRRTRWDEDRSPGPVLHPGSPAPTDSIPRAVP